jgi:hypothetical protein
MNDDRRNDLGYKMTFTLFVGIISLLLGLLVHSAWSTASEGNTNANVALSQAKQFAMESMQRDAEQRVLIAGMQSTIVSIASDTNEIKTLLKRTTK